MIHCRNRLQNTHKAKLEKHLQCDLIPSAKQQLLLVCQQVNSSLQFTSCWNVSFQKSRSVPWSLLPPAADLCLLSAGAAELRLHTVYSWFVGGFDQRASLFSLLSPLTLSTLLASCFHILTPPNPPPPPLLSRGLDLSNCFLSQHFFSSSHVFLSVHSLLPPHSFWMSSFHKKWMLHKSPRSSCVCVCVFFLMIVDGILGHMLHVCLCSRHRMFSLESGGWTHTSRKLTYGEVKSENIWNFSLEKVWND